MTKLQDLQTHYSVQSKHPGDNRGHCQETQYHYFSPLLPVATMNTKPYQRMSAQYMLVTMYTNFAKPKRYIRSLRLA